MHLRPLRTRLLSGALSLVVAAAGLTFITAGAASAAALGLPAAGQTLLAVGQDSDTLSDYHTTAMAAGAPAPSVITLYTNITEGGSPAPLAGMFSPTNYGTGTMDFQRSMAEFPNAGLAVGLYLSDSSGGCGNQPLRAIIGRTDADITPALTAQYRSDIDRMITTFKGYDRNVYLRIGYEFDGPWNCYNSDFYKAAFIYIKGRIDTLGATKVATVWQTAAWPVNGSATYNYDVTNPNHLSTWYPGDQYVDYVGFSDFYNVGSVSTQWGCSSYDVNPVTAQDTVLSFARSHSKPAMIAEAAPQGYRTGAQTKSCTGSNTPLATTGQAIWDEWYAGYFDYIKANSDVIRIASYIDTNWDSQPLWQCTPGVAAGTPGCAQGNWGDSRVQANPVIEAAWITAVTSAPFASAAAVVATPVFTPVEGSYTVAQSVTIADATSGAEVHFTTDGSTPTVSSPTYTGAINVSSSVTIKAIGTLAGSTTSAVASATYAIGSTPVVATPTFSPAGGSFTTTQSVIIADANSGAAIHYTTDGTTPTTSSPTFSGPISVATTTTIKAIGTLAGSTTSPVASATFTISAATGDFTQSATQLSTGAALVSFTPTTAAAYVDIHWSVNGASQQNYRMTLASGTWTQTISGLSTGSVLTYFFTYEKNGPQYDSANFSYTQT